MSNQIAAITPAIRTIRGQKVILDFDLARIYGVTTKRLNEQVKRNAKPPRWKPTRPKPTTRTTPPASSG